MQSKTSFANKLRKATGGSRNPNLDKAQVHEDTPRGIVPGHLEKTEEVLRKHYFMAKATQKTSHATLNRETSPQRHVIKASDADTELKADLSVPAGIAKYREDNIESLQG